MGAEYGPRDRKRLRRKAAKWLPALLWRTRGRCHWCGVPVVRVGAVPRADRVRVTAYALLFWRRGRLKWVAMATVEHVVPLGEGGLNEFGNVVAACRRCNERRNAEQVERARKRREGGA
jgi:5-methylcytosine-specific restriction endonuclease McrA